MTYDEIKNILSDIKNPADKLEFVMDLGRDLNPMPKDAAPVSIKGCASRVEIYRAPDNRIYGTADSALVLGIVAILLSIADGCTVQDIRKLCLRQKISDLGLQLGAGRLSGLESIIQFLENM